MGAHATVLAGLSDRVMVRYLVFRIALAAVGMLDVFIVIYTMQELGLQRISWHLCDRLRRAGHRRATARSLGSRREAARCCKPLPG
ncbi:MAG: hypothetical protein R2848_08920 [Thermomicrobiales bacterium]